MDNGLFLGNRHLAIQSIHAFTAPGNSLQCNEYFASFSCNLDFPPIARPISPSSLCQLLAKSCQSHFSVIYPLLYIHHLLPMVGESKTRVYKLKVGWTRFNKNLRSIFFTRRVVGVWNEVPEEVEVADTTTVFKRHLDRYMDRKILEWYWTNGTSIDGTSWLAWMGWFKGLLFMLYDS